MIAVHETLRSHSGGGGWPDPLRGETLIAHSLRGEGFDASEDGTGRGTPLVAQAIALCGRNGGATVELGDEQAFALRASTGGGDKPYALIHYPPISAAMKARDSKGVSGNGDGDGLPVIAIRTAQTNANGHGIAVEVAHTLDGAQGQAVAVGVDCYNGALTGDVSATLGTPGSSVNASGPTLLQGMQVRRLTPRECERLQGFPDDHTLVSYRGAPAADGPRYKALGNSMAVPVMRWIGERIQLIHGQPSRAPEGEWK